MLLRIALITDIHHGFDVPGKKGSKSLLLLDRFIRASKMLNADVVIDLGDRIIRSEADSDLFYLKQLKTHFNKLAAPLLHVHGNHDLCHLTRQQNEDVLGVPGDSYVRELANHTFVMWNPDVTIDPHKGLSLRPQDLEWLENALAEARSPCILSSHIPLDNDDYDNTSVQKYDGKSFGSFYPQGPEARRIIEESGKVMMCFAGHRHRNRHLEINSVHYITRQSLVQCDQLPDKSFTPPYEAFSMVDIRKDSVRVKGYERKHILKPAGFEWKRKTFEFAKPDLPGLLLPSAA